MTPRQQFQKRLDEMTLAELQALHGVTDRAWRKLDESGKTNAAVIVLNDLKMVEDEMKLPICPRCQRVAVGWPLKRRDVCSPKSWKNCIRQPKRAWMKEAGQ